MFITIRSVRSSLVNKNMKCKYAAYNNEGLVLNKYENKNVLIK